MTLTINQILPNNGEEFFRMLKDGWSSSLRVAIPGIIQSFDPNTQTVTVQPTIQEDVLDPKTLESKPQSLPLLVDVPIIVPRAGGFALTLPIRQGDECIVLFQDFCFDAWWQNGGTKNTQPDKRRHDLSDGVALLAPTSQPKVLSNYSTTSAQLRTEDGSQYIDLSSNGIALKGNVTVDGTLTTTGSMTVPSAEIGGIAMTTHTHVAPNGGGTTSGPS